jgi:phosphatidylinositol alpha-1,6-mannosyltransferase
MVEHWGVPKEKIVIVHPPLSEQAARMSHHSQLNAPSDVFTLVTVSRLVASKGIDTVLRALKILEQSHVKYRYIVAGMGSERASLEKLAKDLHVADKVRFTGFIEEEDKWRLLRSADVYVMPSRFSPDEPHEGFGIAFLEAAACGIPAIGSNAGGIPDAVLHGRTGLLVEPDSPEELANALMFLYLDTQKRKEMGMAGMERVRAEFSPRAVALRFQNESPLGSLMKIRKEFSIAAAGSGAYPQR